MASTETDTLKVKTDQPVQSTSEPIMEELVTREVVESIIKSANPDLELLEFTSVPGTQAGDNFMSIMYALTVHVQSKHTNSKSILNIMLKTMPGAGFRQQLINDCGAFVKDISMYEQVSPDFISFQKKKGLNGDEIFQGFPECYATFHNGTTDYLALENLRPKGYKMGGRVEGLDFDHSEIVVRSMAKYHAISYAMFQGDYDAILRTYPFLEEKMYRSEELINEVQKSWMGATFDKVAQLMCDMGHPAEAETVKLFYNDPKKFWDNLHLLVGKKVPHAIVGHGDCWTNNFLFRYDEISGKPIEIKFVDYQLARVCSRALDLGYFLYTSPATAVLNQQKDELLRIYHDEFITFTRKLGLPEELQQSFEDFSEEVDHYKIYGIIMGLMLLPIISAGAGDVPSFDDFKDEVSTSDADKFFGQVMNKTAEAKLLNLIAVHCVNVKFLRRD